MQYNDYQGAPLPEGHAPVKSILVWWNDDYRLWTVQRMDGEGNQLDGEACQSAHKRDAIHQAKAFLSDHPAAQIIAGTRAAPPEPLLD